MATLITGDNLRKATQEGGFIKSGAPTSVEGAKYDFRMSPLILKSSYGTPVDISKMTEQERTQVRVDPGEVVFVRTIELLALPKNVTALLSPKRKLSHQGIIALGGFCIDPLYRGPLWVGLYNFSSTPFPLQPGKKLIAALFYELSGAELTDFPVPEATTEGDFPDELVTLIRNYKPIELRSLSESIVQLHARVDSIVTELRDDRDWQRTVKAAIDEHNKQLGVLIEGLKEEKETRRQDDERIRTRLETVEQQAGGFRSTVTSGFRIAWVIAALILAAVLGGLAQHYIPKSFP